MEMEPPQVRDIRPSIESPIDGIGQATFNVQESILTLEQVTEPLAIARAAMFHDLAACPSQQTRVTANLRQVADTSPIPSSASEFEGLPADDTP
jgi:hypothetical protein